MVYALSKLAKLPWTNIHCDSLYSKVVETVAVIVVLIVD